jgi:predicted nucleotidyltransferase
MWPVGESMSIPSSQSIPGPDTCIMVVSPPLDAPMHALITQCLPAIAAVCQRHGIARLEVFGSAARADDFDPQTSDVDFLVEFVDQPGAGLSAYFGAKHDLEQLLGRAVDLVEPAAVRNPYVMANINRHREAVYAA